MQSPPPLSSFPIEGCRRRHSRSDRDRCHQERASRVTPLGSGPDLPRPIACRRATAGRVDAGPAVLAPPPYLSTTADTCAPAEKETTTNCKWRRACLPACFRWRVERGAGERPSSFAGAPGALILCSAPAAEEEQGGDGGGGGAVRHPEVVQGLAQGAGGRHPARQHPGVRVLAGLRRGVPADAHVLEPRRAPLPLPPPVDRLQPRRCPRPPKDPHLQGLCGRNHHHVHPRKEGQHQGVLATGSAMAAAACARKLRRQPFAPLRRPAAAPACSRPPCARRHAEKMPCRLLQHEIKFGALDVQMVAVKQQARESVQGRKEFLVEVLMLTVLSHPNFVSLVGFCAQGTSGCYCTSTCPSAA